MPIQRLVDRIKQRLTSPAANTPTPSLIQRIKDRILGPQTAPVKPDLSNPASLPTGGPPPVAVMRMLIRQAGRAQTLLLAKHNGVWRHIEPYSFRPNKAKDGSYREPLFYAYCRLHDEIHSFYLSKFEGMVMTDEPFAPRWDVEVAR